MASSTAFLTTDSFLNEKETMTRDLGTSNIKTVGFRKKKKWMSQIQCPLPQGLKAS